MDIKVAVNVSFVIPDGSTNETDCSEDMQRAFEACRQNLMDVKWINNVECLNPDELQKNDFIVFQSFEGRTFDKMKDSKGTRIIGPLCLLTCLSEGRPIPNLSWPISNMAMADCYISCSHLPKNIKEEIKNKVQYMGGHFTTSVFQVNTHLVTDSVKSQKYLKAAMSGIKIMLPTWVEAVWKCNLNSNVNCNDKQFENYRCLPLQNLTICTTGITVIEERKQLQNLIEKNGGKYSGQMHINHTDILVCKGNTSSEKFKVAKKLKTIKCVTSNWITDSIEKGYALPETDYAVERGTSTPTKNEEFINPNFSTISAISNTTHLTTEVSVLQETINTTTMCLGNETKKRKSSSIDDLNDVVDKIDLKRVKRAGSFLDGCSIYLAGFESEQREKLCKILNFSGATRYEDLSDRLTHIIVGDTTCLELKLIQSKTLQVPIVNVEWLRVCVEREQMVPEENYLISPKNDSPKECGSPLSKKGLQLLRSNASVMENNSSSEQESLEQENDINKEIMMQYLNPSLTNQEEDTLAQLLKDGTNPFEMKTNTNQSNKAEQTNPLPNTTSDTTNCSTTLADEDSTQLSLIFENLKFMIVNFDEEEYLELKDNVESWGGEVVPKSYKGIPDYAVVPPFNNNLTQTATEIVTDYWLAECWRDIELRNVEYYHRPFAVRQHNVLDGCVVTISGYTGTERLFLINLIKELGGISQEQLSRIEKNGILASTHLLSPVASGIKYEAAVKWGRPIVNKEWLFECAKLGKFVAENNFLVGDSKAPQRSQEISVQNNTTPVVQHPEKNTPQRKSKNEKTLTPAQVLSNTNKTPKKAPFNVINVETPTTSKIPDDQDTRNRTPINKIIGNENNSPNICSQVTPVNKIMNEVRSTYMLGTPLSTPPLPKRWGDVDTPDTPLGAFIRPNPSPHLRKEMLKWINTIPDSKSRRLSTPLSELKRRLWDKICPPRNPEDKSNQPDFDTSSITNDPDLKSIEKPNTPETPENIMIKSKLQQLEEMLSSNGGNRKSAKKRESTVIVGAELKDSQACTVGWDYAECDDELTKETQIFHFMLSGVNTEEREELTKQLQSLGATVSDLPSYDHSSTHLIMNKPLRNEKILSSMAAGKWILHPDYIKKSLEVGKLVNEEEFEYGNPNFSKDIKLPMDRDIEMRINTIYWWRKEITKRGYGAFHDMRAIVVSNKREPIVRVIEAGGGMVIIASPPFDKEIYATHCLLDLKFVSDMSQYIPLAEQGIYIFSILYINDFLHRTVKDVKDSILPAFQRYYD